MLKGFSDVVENQNHKSVERFHQLINEELENLTTVSSGWSNWDNTTRLGDGHPCLKKGGPQVLISF